MFATASVNSVLEKLGTSRDGLSDAEVYERIEQYGYNELPEKKRSLFLLFLKQFQSILVYILIVALALSIVLPLYENSGVITVTDFLDAIAIGIILILNALLGFFQEKKAENAIAFLKQMSTPNVRVQRGSKIHIIPSRELVPGDILFLEEGDKVSADGRILKALNAAVDEASLTGESKPARKHAEVLTGKPGIADQTNMVFRGTTVTAGHMTVCITATGQKTELGKIAELVSTVEEPPTPLEKSMEALGKWLGMVVLVFCGMIFVAGEIHNLPFEIMILAAASLAVSAVPEGLPAIVTVCLAMGVQRMIKRKVLTRELSAIETLGSITVICTDKTGTITENSMAVQQIIADDKHLALEIAGSCNYARSLTIGDPTEIGLLQKAEEEHVARLPIVDEDVPFSSEYKYMMTSHEKDGKRVQYLKGAPEVIVELCNLSTEKKESILEKNKEMASNALRVLAMAKKDPANEKAEYVGLIGMMDPPRDGVKEAIALARSAGIRTIIITGDHALTAKAIAAKVGVESGVIPGADLDGMNDAELSEIVKECSIFARVSPEHKVKILTALQNLGEIVAMGGDGVNDAPALKKAHVGFAMGKRGTDVARETAEIVLTNDHFASVVNAIEEGRTIYDNINKFIVFLLRANFDELMVVFLSIMFGMPLPYLPIHLLIINLMTDSLPAMALAMEKPEPNVMQRKPRDPKEHILHGEVAFIVLAAIIATVAAFHIFFAAGGMHPETVDTARTMVVVGSIMFELTLVFTCRSKRSLLEIGPFSNHYLLGAVSIAFVSLLLLVYTPIAPFVRFVPLTLSEWILPLAWSFGALFFFEVLKLFHTGSKDW